MPCRCVGAATGNDHILSEASMRIRSVAAFSLAPAHASPVCRHCPWEIRSIDMWCISLRAPCRMAQKGLPSKQTEFSLMAARERLARSWERVVLQASPLHRAAPAYEFDLCSASGRRANCQLARPCRCFQASNAAARQVCDDYFFFSSVEECAEAAVADLAAFDDGADLVRPLACISPI